jgi:hypothetical protein
MNKPNRPPPPALARKTVNPPQIQQKRTAPVAPPVYRPQRAPKVLQTKSSSAHSPQAGQAPRQPSLPPVYRPEARKAIQPKAVTQERKSPTAPPVYRQEQKKIAQPKMASTASAHTPPKAPAIHRPQPNVNARPSLPAQMRSKVIAPAASPPQSFAPHAELRRGNSVVQRAIVIGDQVYGPGEAEALNNRYPGTEREEMLSVMSDFPHYPRSIAAALADPRRFYLTRKEDENGVAYVAEADALPTQVIGGRTREAGSRPVLITRPDVGFEGLEIKGLIMCVGIIIEAQREGRIQAAAGSHFVTNDMITDGEINQRGRMLIEMQIQMVRHHGTPTALLMHILGQGGPHRTGSESDGDLAVRQITDFLLDRSIKGVNITAGLAQRSYRLNTDGTSTLT